MYRPHFPVKKCFFNPPSLTPSYTLPSSASLLHSLLPYSSPLFYLVLHPSICLSTSHSLLRFPPNSLSFSAAAALLPVVSPHCFPVLLSCLSCFLFFLDASDSVLTTRLEEKHPTKTQLLLSFWKRMKKSHMDVEGFC